MPELNAFNQYVGDLVPGWETRPLPQPVSLVGRSVSVVPLSSAHYADLFAALPAPIREAVTARWGDPATDPFCRGEHFHLPAIALGNFTWDWIYREYRDASPDAPQMIALVERLVAAGTAYQAEDGSVYFAIRRFPSYGRLSRLDTRELKTGARVAQDDYTKENAQDFALWKAAKPEDERVGAAWESPWGRGRPGWHLECSAMAMDILGETLDVHCGGIDLVFPHHEDEIAQSEGATGQPFDTEGVHAGREALPTSADAWVAAAAGADRPPDPRRRQRCDLSAYHGRRKR